MKHLVLNFCAASLCCFLTIAVDAQNINGAAVQTTDGKTSIADPQITSSYDETKKQTTVEFRMLGISNTKTEWVLLSVSATYEGRKLVKQPEAVDFVLSIGSTKENRFPQVMAFEITVDGKRVAKGPILNADQRRVEGDDKRQYLETLVTVIRYEIFKKLIQAKSLTLQLPDLRLQLDETRIAKMRELDALLHP